MIHRAMAEMTASSTAPISTTAGLTARMPNICPINRPITGMIATTDTCCAVRGLGGDYSNYIYTADLKLAGVGRRLGLDIGPLRYLLLSVTYGTKGYPSGPLEDRQRRVGFDVGLNLAEIVSDLGVRRNTWWGYLLQAFTENVRVPYTAGGFRYDMNHGRWYGPTTR